MYPCQTSVLLGFHLGAEDSLGGIVANYDVVNNLPLPLGQLSPVDQALVLWWPRFLAVNRFPRFCDTRPIMYERVITTGLAAHLDFAPVLASDRDFDETTNPIAPSASVPPPHTVAWMGSPVAVEVAQSVLTEPAMVAAAPVSGPAIEAGSQAPPSMVFVGAFSFFSSHPLFADDLVLIAETF